MGSISKIDSSIMGMTAHLNLYILHIREEWEHDRKEYRFNKGKAKGIRCA